MSPMIALAVVVMLAAEPQSAQDAVLPQSVSRAPAAEPGQDVPNTALKHMYELRAARQRSQRTTALVVGATLLLGGALTIGFLRDADARTVGIALPWGIEAALLGSVTLLGGSAATGSALRAKADTLDPAGTTPLRTILAEERAQYQGTGRVLGLSLGVGGGLAALGTVFILAGPGNEPAWKSSGAALLSLGVVLGALGLFVWNEARQALAQLDRGVIEDLGVVNPGP